MTDPTPEPTAGEITPRALPAVPPRPVSGGPITSVWGQAVHDALFAPASLPDVRDGWRATAIAANQASTDVPRSDGGLPPLGGFPGQIVGFWWRHSAGPITGGQINLSAQVGGTISPPAVINAAAGSTGLVTLATPLPFTASTAVRMNYSSAALAPAATIALQAGLLVRYDYVPG